MNLPLSDQVIALIRFTLSLVVAAFTVWGCVHFGLVRGSAYFGIGLVVVTTMQLVSGPALRGRNAPAPAPDNDDNDND